VSFQPVYQEKRSWFHSLDPITKTTWVLLATIWLYFLSDLPNVVLVSTLVLTVAILGARIKLTRYVKVVVSVLAGSMMLILYQGIFRSGPGIVFGSVRLSFEGMRLGAALSLRTFGIVAGGLALSLTTRPKHIMLAMIRLGCSYRVAYVVYLALRFLPVCAADLQANQDAMAQREIKKGVGWYVKSVVAVVITELGKVDDTAIAMETRAFGLYEFRTSLEKISIARSGVLLVAVTAVIMVAHLLWLWV